MTHVYSDSSWNTEKPRRHEGGGGAEQAGGGGGAPSCARWQKESKPRPPPPPPGPTHTQESDSTTLFGILKPAVPGGEREEREGRWVRRRLGGMGGGFLETQVGRGCGWGVRALLGWVRLAG